MYKEILIAMWINNNKTELAVKAKMLNDLIEQHRVQKYTSDGQLSEQYKALLSLYSEDKIEEDTKRISNEKLQNQASNHRQNEKQEADRIRMQYTQRLFETKLELFEIPEIKNSEDRLLRSRIRRAKTVAEAYTLGALLLQREMDSTTPIV